jgi:hypothetical protein
MKYMVRGLMLTAVLAAVEQTKPRQATIAQQKMSAERLNSPKTLTS